MHRFFVKEDQIGDEAITITGTDVNHIKNVLRMKTNEEIIISNGQDREYRCIISSVSDSKVTAKIVDICSVVSELPGKFYLFQALPKSDKMEWIIQKAVELGVYEIIPVVTKRAIVKIHKNKEQAKLKRFNEIAASAAKQSHRGIIPHVTAVMSFEEAIQYAAGLDINLIPYENEKSMYDTKELIYTIKEHMKVGIFIGPEGGFADSEIEKAKATGMKAITLGRRILRTETAGMVLMSVLMFHLEK